MHVGGSFNTTRAAWPHMVEQGYGRIVMTTLLGDVRAARTTSRTRPPRPASSGSPAASRPQAPRTASRSTLIAPAAMTRMAGSRRPSDSADATPMAPELVAPMVAFLAHEDCPVSGEIYAAGAGRFAPHLHRVRPRATSTRRRRRRSRTSREHWATINDETGYYVPADLMGWSAAFMAHLAQLDRSRSSRFRTLPEGFRGSSSMNTTSFGTLNFASCRAAVLDELLGRRRAGELDDDVRDRDLAPALVGTADDRDLDHRLVLVEHALDLGAGDVLAAGHDHVLEPIDDVEVAVVVPHADVAGVEPAARERRARSRRDRASSP